MMNLKKSRVEQALDDSWKKLQEYKPSEFALEFMAFQSLVNHESGIELNKTPKFHLMVADSFASRSKNVANMIFRGASKSTQARRLISYLVIKRRLPNFKSEIKYLIYVSDSIDTGVKYMRKNIEHMIESSPFLSRMIPVVEMTDKRWYFENANGEKFVVRAYGAKTGIRGSLEFGIRPQIAIFDDLISDDDARSAKVIAAIEDVVNKAAEYAMNPQEYLIIWFGTPFSEKDPLYKAIESGAWESNVFPVCYDINASEKDFKPFWGDRFDYETLKKKYNRSVDLGRPKDFMQEMMLRIISSDESMIDLNEDIVWEERAKIIANLSRHRIILTSDFAVSEKSSADYNVFLVWAVSNDMTHYLIDGSCEKTTFDVSLNRLFHLVESYDVKLAGFEVAGQQGGLVSVIEREMIRRQTYFTIARQVGKTYKGIRPNSSKIERFSAILPLFKRNKIVFMSEHKDRKYLRELIAELSMVTPDGIRSLNDDAVDALSMLSEMRFSGGMDDEKDNHNDKNLDKIPSPVNDVYDDFSIDYDDSPSINRYI